MKHKVHNFFQYEKRKKSHVFSHGILLEILNICKIAILQCVLVPVQFCDRQIHDLCILAFTSSLLCSLSSDMDFVMVHAKFYFSLVK